MKLKETIGMQVMKSKFWVKQHAPEILLAGSLACSTGAVITAGISGAKVSKILDATEARTTEIKNRLATDITYDEEQAAKDNRANLFNAGLKISKTCALPFVLQAVTVGCIIANYKTLGARYSAAVAASAALQHELQKYQKAVADEVGEDKAKEIRTNALAEAARARANEERACNLFSMYAFDESNSRWDGSFPDANMIWLRSREREWNHILWKRSGSPVYLNEVLADLGLATEPEYGDTYGWVWDERSGMNTITFGFDNMAGSDLTHYLNNDYSVIYLTIEPAGEVYKLVRDSSGLGFIGSGNKNRDMIDYPGMYENV